MYYREKVRSSITITSFIGLFFVFHCRQIYDLSSIHLFLHHASTGIPQSYETIGNFFNVLAARKRNLTTDRARKNKQTTRKDHSIPLLQKNGLLKLKKKI